MLNEPGNFFTHSWSSGSFPLLGIPDGGLLYCIVAEDLVTCFIGLLNKLC